MRPNDEVPLNPEDFPADRTADRGMPSLTRPHGGNLAFLLKIITGLAVIGIMILVGVTYGANKWKVYRQHQAEERSKKADSKPNIGKLDTSGVRDHPAEGSSVAPVADGGLPPPPVRRVGGPGGPTASTGTAQTADAQRRADAEAAERAAAKNRVATAPILAFGSSQGASKTDGKGSGDASTAGDVVLQAMRGQVDAGKPAAADAGSLSSSLKSTTVPDRVATQMSNMSLTIARGTVMHCGLVTAIDSTVPGFVKCILTEDVYSANGRAVLAERGSEVNGQYESASLKQGMSRIFVLWTQLRTPHGVTITLDSPSTDALGRSGVDGTINNHFWARFGSGLLLSVVDDVSASAMNRSSGGQLQLSSTQGEGKDAASIALSHSVDIPPTLTKDQGAQLNVWVASDLYFGGVYGFQSAQR